VSTVHDSRIRYVLEYADRGSRAILKDLDKVRGGTARVRQENLAQARAATGSSKAIQEATKRQTVAVESAARARQAAVEKEARSLRSQGRSYQDIAHQLGTNASHVAKWASATQESVHKQEAAISGLEAQYRKLSGTSDAVSKQTVAHNKRSEESWHGVAKNALRAGVAMGAAYVGISQGKNAIDTTIGLAKSTELLHKTLGLTVEKASEWAAVAQARGLDTKKLGMSFSQLSRNVVAATAATGKHKDTLELLRKTQNSFTGSQRQAVQVALHAKQGSLEQTTALDALKKASKGMTFEQKEAIKFAGQHTAATGKQSAAFKQLGLTQADLSRGSHDFNFLLEKVTGGFTRLAPGVNKAALAQQLFGRGWQALMPILNSGTKGMNDQLNTAKAMGATFSGSTIQQMNQLVEAEHKMKFATIGLQIAFTEHVAPALIKVAHDAGTVAKIFNDKNLTGDEKWKRVSKVIGGLAGGFLHGFQQILPHLIAAAATAGVRMAPALIGAFFSSGPVGMLVGGGWLLKKLGLWGIVGKKLGATLGVGIAEGAAPEIAAVETAAGGGAAAAGGAGGLLAGRLGMVAKGGLVVGAGVLGGGMAMNQIARATQSRTLHGLSGVGGTANLMSTLSGNALHGNFSNMGQLFRSTAPLQNFAKNADANLRSLVSAGNVKGVQALADQADKLAKKWPVASQKLRDFSVSARGLGAATATATHAVDAFGTHSYKTIAEVRDRYTTNMKLIAATIGLNSAKGRELAAKNFDAMATAIEKSVRTGRMSVLNGTHAITGLWEHSSKQQRDILVTHYHRNYQDLVHALHTHRISLEQFNGQRAKLQQQADATLRTDARAAFHKRLQDLDKAHADGHITDKVWRARREKLFSDESRTLEKIHADLHKNIVTDADRAGREMQGKWAKWWGSITGMFSKQGGALSRIIGGIKPPSFTAGDWSKLTHNAVHRQAGGPVHGYATGGLAHPGGPPNRHDTVPAWLQPGEFVIRKSAVEKHGVSALHSLNRGATMGPLATGLTSAAALLYAAARATGAGSGVQGLFEKQRTSVRVGSVMGFAAGGPVPKTNAPSRTAQVGAVNLGRFGADSAKSVQHLRDQVVGHMKKITDTVQVDTTKVRDVGKTRFKDLDDTITKHMKSSQGQVSTATKGISELWGKATKQDRSTLLAHQKTTFGDLAKSLHDRQAGHTQYNAYVEKHQVASNQTLRSDLRAHYSWQQDALSKARQGQQNTDATYSKQRQGLYRNEAGVIERVQSSLNSTLFQDTRSLGQGVTGGFSKLASALNQDLKALGAKPVSFSAGKFAGGGRVPGAIAGDHLALLHRSGGVAGIVDGQELVANRHTERRVDSLLAPYGTTLGREVAGETRLHAAPMLAKGGRASSGPSHYQRLIAAANKVSAKNFPYVLGGGHEQPAHFEPLDCSGAVSYVTQQAGYRVPTEVSGGMGAWGFPKGPGEATVFYNGGHTFMRIGSRYFGTSGFARPGGGAGWFNQSPGAGYLSGFQTIHLPDLGAGGDGGYGTLPTPKLKGPAGGLRSLGQGALSRLAGGANDYLSKMTAKMSPGGGQALSEPYGGGGNLSGWLDAAMRLTGVGGGLWKNVLTRQAMRESSGNPNPGTIADINSAQGNPSEGLLQTTLSTFKANMLRGHGNILNPVDNAAAAIRYMIGTYGHGNPGAAAQAMWARGGGAYAKGGRLGYAGEFAGGGSFTTKGPTMFLAGEKGSEDVHVVPRAQTGARMASVDWGLLNQVAGGSGHGRHHRARHHRVHHTHRHTHTHTLRGHAGRSRRAPRIGEYIDPYTGNVERQSPAAHHDQQIKFRSWALHHPDQAKALRQRISGPTAAERNRVAKQRHEQQLNRSIDRILHNVEYPPPPHRDHLTRLDRQIEQTSQHGKTLRATQTRIEELLGHAKKRTAHDTELLHVVKTDHFRSLAQLQRTVDRVLGVSRPGRPGAPVSPFDQAENTLTSLKSLGARPSQLAAEKGLLAGLPKLLGTLNIPQLFRLGDRAQALVAKVTPQAAVEQARIGRVQDYLYGLQHPTARKLTAHQDKVVAADDRRIKSLDKAAHADQAHHKARAATEKKAADSLRRHVEAIRSGPGAHLAGKDLKVAEQRSKAEIARLKAESAAIVRLQNFQKALDQINAAMTAAAQRQVDLAQAAGRMTDLSEARIGLQQQLAGTFDSIGGAQGRADYIRAQVIPGIQAEIGALVAQQQVANRQGDQVLAQQIGEAIGQRQNDVLQRQLDAQDAIKQATQASAQAIAAMNGTLAFQYQGQSFTDLVGTGVGV